MKNLILIDAHSLIHRCFHALPPFTNSKGESVGSLYGISSVLLKIINQKNPDYIAALFDRPEPTFRKKKFSDYKIHRPKAPDELVSQIISAHKLFESFGIKTFEKPGYEGDDLIGTFAEIFKREKDLKIIILTGDLDSLQLIEDGKVYVETFKKGISETMVYDPQAVFERYGIYPKDMIEYKSLVGDSSDNIPGVPKVGPKTAVEIIKKYGTVENFLKNGKDEKGYDRIYENRDLAKMSKELSSIICDVKVDVKLNDLKYEYNKERILDYFKENNFLSLAKRIEEADPKKTPTRKSERGVNRKQNLFDLKGGASDKITISHDRGGGNVKVGFDLKGYFKEQKQTSPFFDVKIAARLLGFEEENEKSLSLKIFKEELDEKEFLEKSFLWFSKKIEEEGLSKIFYEIELPLIPVIALMEKNGIKIDRELLNEIKIRLEKDISGIEREVRMVVGKQINLNSPKQLLEFFQKRGHKIKSTGAEKLDKIKESEPIIEKILKYRELFKLKTTYLDGMEKLIEKDGKIHPNFLQLGAATGRMSCQNPNLQNIPQESEWSKQIRNAFVPKTGSLLVSFDYSQIELRVLAFLSQDKNMVKAFKDGFDIHTITAQKIFNKKEIDKNERRLAKTLNFGMIYGMGYRAFSQQSGLEPEKAKEFIKKYFEEFPAIKEWQKETLGKARIEERVKNVNGRFRNIPQINSFNQFMASEAERMVMNMPIQSLAADVMKTAMIEVNKFIEREGLGDKINIILSIHDEIVFEISKGLLKSGKESEIIKKIGDIMENVFSLGAIPLKTEVKIGERWGEME